jgi:hypothetical protein
MHETFLKKDCVKMLHGKLMTMDEKLAIDMQSIALEQAGKHDEAMALAKTVPLSPSLAMLCKKRLGADAVRQLGWNLAEAEVEFGPDWLDR